VKLMTTCKLMLKVLVPLALIVMMVSTVYAAPPTQLWSDAVDTNDIAPSKDGNYVAVASGNQLRFYGRSSATPLWTSRSQDEFSSVAISADGDCVAVGGMSNVYFWKNARTLTGSGIDTQTWVSVSLGGSIDRRCIDISDDGNYVAACGTGTNVFYWANAKGKSGTNIATTWTSPVFNNVEAVALSSNGDFVSAAVDNDKVAYWKNARSLTNTQSPNWVSPAFTGEFFVDIAVSDDGNYIAVAGTASAGPSTVYYWAGATSLSGNPSPTWSSGIDIFFSSIDISSDGNSVIAGVEGPSFVGVHFWAGAKGLSGTVNPTWTFPTTDAVRDVAINSAGDFMAAANDVSVSRVYFFDAKGNLLWSPPFQLDNPVSAISLSGDGGTLAVGTSARSTGYLLSTGFSSGNLPNPVGGVVLPTNTLAILTPYLALAGLIVAVSAVVVVKKRR